VIIGVVNKITIIWVVIIGNARKKKEKKGKGGKEEV
jgi:hypothetical protein